jgi:hypothetical protein
MSLQLSTLQSKLPPAGDHGPFLDAPALCSRQQEPGKETSQLQADGDRIWGRMRT